MKKIILFVCMAVCILTACENKNAYTLTGTFANGDQDGNMVYLQQLDSTFQRNIIDSAKVENSQFIFNGIVKETPAVQIIMLENNFYRFIVEKGKIEMNFDAELNVTVKGTAMNEQYRLFEMEKDDLFEKMGTAYRELTSIKEAGSLTLEQFREFKMTSKKSIEELENIIYNFIKPNITTSAGQYFFLIDSYYLNGNQIKELISLSTPDFKQLEYVQRLEKQAAAKTATEEGQQFTDVKGFDFDGKEVKLSDYAGKGKVVLIDFWASWCGPCVRAMPELITIYQQYKNKGFEIVGISLDESEESWKKATENLKITWPQFSNLKGWKEDCAVTYGVNGIPHAILIDKDGKIIKCGLDGVALKFKLEELLGNK
jgi:thiol-disulfide isomerase/thioredoxin